MRDQLSTGLNMAMAGIPRRTTDIGGFHSGDVDDPAFHQLILFGEQPLNVPEVLPAARTPRPTLTLSEA